MREKQVCTIVGNVFFCIVLLWPVYVIANYILFHITSGAAKHFFAFWGLFFGGSWGPITILCSLISFILKIVAIAKKQSILWNVLIMIASLAFLIFGIVQST